MSDQPASDQILDLLLDALAERQARREAARAGALPPHAVVGADALPPTPLRRGGRVTPAR